MELIKIIKSIFKPSYEVEPEKFYSEFLNQKDAQDLRSFVSDFSSKLSIPSAIIAVGSSVFPHEYFDNIKKINQEDPNIKINESYRDIDLLIVPKEIVKLNDLEKSVQETLFYLGLKNKPHEITLLGSNYGKQSDGTYAPFLNVDYGLHSIETYLKNGTKLDLILGRDDLLKQTAHKKIKKERNRKNPFSLLYI